MTNNEAKLITTLGTGLIAGYIAKELTRNYGAKKSRNIGRFVAGLTMVAMYKKVYAQQGGRTSSGTDLWFHIGKNMDGKKSGISWEKSADVYDWEFSMVKRFAQDIMNSETEAGKRFLYLHTSKKHNVIIKVSKTGRTETDAKNWEKACNGDGTVAFVNINIMDTGLYDKEEIRKDLRASLAHEVAGHSYNFCKGISTYRGDGYGTWEGLCKEEQSATAIENEIRDYYLLPQRKKYDNVWDVPIFDKKTSSWYLLPGEFDKNGGYRTIRGEAKKWYPQ